MPLMATSSKMEVLNSSTIRPFENDDYDYLINCTDLITTCQEALQENNFEADQKCDQNHSVKSEENCAKLSPLCHNCDEHVSLRSPSSAASSGLGLSLEEDSSLKYCHSDEEFSSLNSTSAESFSAKALVAEFIEWLDYAENQLDSVCYCAKIASSASGVVESLQLPTTEADTTGAVVPATSSSSSSHHGDDLADCRSANDQGDKWCADVNRSAVELHCAKKKSDAGVNEQNEVKVGGQKFVEVIDHEDGELVNEVVEGDKKEEQKEEEVVGEEGEDEDEDGVEEEEDEDGVEYAFYEDEEAEELMMSLRPERQYSGSNPRKTTKLCLSETVADWSVILARFKAFHNEFEKIAHRFLTETSAIRQSLSGSLLLKSLHPTQKRCQNLWLKVLEYSIILQDYPPGTRCPRHFSRKLSSRVQTQFPEKHSLRPKQPFQQQQQHQSEATSIKSALGGSYNSIFASGPLAQYRAIVCGGLRRAGTANRKVELKSTGTGGSSVSIHHRRVQTRSDSTMMEHQEAVIDTHSADGNGSASPGADSGVFSSSTDCKYEVIQKDIGYSSDADMSDAIEAHPHSSDQNSSQRLARKRQVRRRRTRTARPRPWSYHADWTDWDYYQTPFVYNGEQGSNEDNFDNENAVRKLTEFGENYESWINNEIELADELKSLKPAVVIEKPEIEAYCERALVEKADASTSPIPFLEKEIDDEKKASEEDEQAVVMKSCAMQTIESKSTQTTIKSVVDSACMTATAANSGSSSSESCSLTTCKSCASTSANSYSSIKFYTSLALAGLFAIFFAVSQFSPEIHKSYSRPPPL